MELTKEEIEEIESFIGVCNYTFDIEDVLEEYEKFKDFTYVSHSFKSVFAKFDKIFTREDAVVLIHRYDIEGVATKLEARNLLALVIKYFTSVRINVEYRTNALSQSVRQQTKLYDVDKVITHFDDKVKGGDVRFIKSWNRYLEILRDVKKLKA